MTVQAVKITNLLSFDELIVDNLNDLNCIVGRNNVGKSNLLKVLKFFYNKLDGKEELPPKLNSNYSYKGSISITFDMTRIYRIARKQPNNKYFSFIIRKLIPLHKRSMFALMRYDNDHTTYTLTLNIYNDGKVKWSTNDKQTLNLILYLFPFFHIEPRHMDLHEWDSLWDLISRLKSFNLSKIDEKSVIDFFDKSINSNGENSYKKYIADLNNTISTKPSSQKEKILSYIKAGLKGYRFEIDENDLKYHSDGTNSFHFIKTFLKILITISRREYITPFVFIDEPELGLHPKMNEVLIHDIYNNYKYKKDRDCKVTRPRIFLATHSPNIVKEIIKKFRNKQRIYCFQKFHDSTTTINVLNSTYNNESFINTFSDNEARLFFSDFILFVEGETELEVFGNMSLSDHFSHLKHIDIYKSSSNVIGERINPSYSNSAIPYIFLFDADKAISLKGTPNNFNLKLQKNGNYFNFWKETLEKEYNKHKLGFSKNHQLAKSNLQYLLNNRDKNLKIDLTKQDFLKEYEFEKVFSSVKMRLLSKNIYLNRTTLEGCLIQINSSKIFYEWMKKENNINFEPILCRISKSKFVTEDMLIDYMRIIYNGKSKALTDYSHFNLESYTQAMNNGKKINGKLRYTSRHAKLLMDLLEKSTIRNKGLEKTDGWATSFINFSVDYIEDKSLTEKQSFGSIFKIYFPELYDIIRMLQPDSRGEI
ncbi:TPA: AAA family ATPase [Vibrio parahaemolyticus]|uniref:retron Eco8 family effector endonuclease n=2 Tax=Vibrio parahaemolyticus TaxID=670 RepID=UPI001A302264|nr:retron Eco8 family effector endonuclease [Vibrio parahaemolyticus]EGV1830903.1 ATP-binding protein [Vibrio parahaemolyticus]EHW0649569.1 retron Eco8 family effector endonuclease [Vibrio parahaemolyticus]MCG0029769.1 retron Eco8 family effector endonuclease [Vibrio parahaemolyticus]HAS6662016.1 AAA family ATPase [Vibrio parahaemolyticus]HAS6663881.1 AAA family ATPase [Vibrio parahaemolyticus]